MDWNVKNAVNRDVERQHLNKILREIRGQIDDAYTKIGTTTEGLDQTNNNLSQTIIKVVETQVPDEKLVTAVKLVGDVTGTSTRTGLNEVTVETTITTGSIEDAPLDDYFYWRRMAQWEQVGTLVSALSSYEGYGILAVNDNQEWESRIITSADDTRLTVVDGDGIAGDPTLDWALVPDSGTGEILGIERDAWGRVSGTREVTTDDLDEGTTNLYFTDQRATDAVGAVLLDTDNILLDYDGTNITADLSTDVLDSLALADSALQDAPSDGEQYARQDGAWQIVDLPPGYTYDDLKASLVASTNVTITPDDLAETLTIAATGGGGGTGTVDSVVAGTGIEVDSTDPANPIVTALVKIPFFLASGDRSDISLTSDSKIPFFLADGTASNIPLET